MLYLWHGKTYEPGDQLPEDLAALVGQKKTVDAKPAAPSQSGDALLLINTAETPDEIAVLPGIGVASAERMINVRNRVGEFKTLDQVRAIPGLPKSGWDAIAAWVAE